MKGKIYYNESYVGTKKEALAKEARLRAEFEVENPVVDVSRSPTWSRFVNLHYLPHAEGTLRKTTVNTRQYTLRGLEGEIGKLKLTEIQTDVVERYVAKLRRRGLRPSTINDRTKLISAVLRYARELKVPCAKPVITSAPDRAKRRVLAWSPEQVTRLLEFVAEGCNDIYPMVLCLAVTGMRCSEVMHLR